MKSSIEIVDVETVGPLVGFKDSNSILNNNSKFYKRIKLSLPISSSKSLGNPIDDDSWCNVESRRDSSIVDESDDVSNEVVVVVVVEVVVVVVVVDVVVDVVVVVVVT